MNKLTRREFVTIGGIGAIGLSAVLRANARNSNGPNELLLYAGTYTNSGRSQGIYVNKFDLGSGELSPLHIIRNVADPSFLTIDKNRKFVYSVNELVEYEGKASGSVSAFAIDQKSGKLEFLNKQPTLGGAPCFVTTSENGKFALVANYVGGNISVFPIAADGKLGTSSCIVQHSGSGPNADRQGSAHAHSITLDRRNRFAFAGDLGIDKLMIYRFDQKTGRLTPNEAQPFFQAKPGAGPRHFTFHPNGRLAFLINELDLTITALAYDEKAGTLREIETASTIPADALRTGSSCADIHVSPNGKFLYGSNRGHNSIVSYLIDQKSGKLKLVEHVSTNGKKPRNFAIDPTGKFLLVANQDSDSIIVFRIDANTGKLQLTGKSAEIPSPVCLKFTPAFR